MEGVRVTCKALGDWDPNHVLINSYSPDEGILPHHDGPLYHPLVAILSLATPAILRFYPPQDPCAGCMTQPPPLLSVVLQPRSLVVFRDTAYTTCMHGIEATSVENVDASVANAALCGLRAGDVLPRGGVRLSLTIRQVARQRRVFGGGVL